MKRGVIVLLALALAASCDPTAKHSSTGIPAAESAVCRPAPFSTAIPIYALSVGNLRLLQTPTERILVMPNVADCGLVNLHQLLDLAGQCGPTCGDLMDAAATKALEAQLLQVRSFDVMLGAQLGRAMATGDGTFVAFPRDADLERTIEEISTPHGGQQVPQELSQCCPGCGPCTGGQCGSTVPVEPRSQVLDVRSRCNCDAIYPRYCPEHPKRPAHPSTCPCADACCAY